MSLSARLLQFGHHLREHEIPVNTAALLDAQKIAACGYMKQRKQLRAGLRSCFCKSPDHWRRFDELFDKFFCAPEEVDAPPSAETDDESTSTGKLSGVQSLLGFGGTSSQKMSHDQTGAGDYKALSLADFRFVFDPQQKQLIGKMVERMAARAKRSYLRRERSASKGERIDFAQSINRSMRNGGNVVQFRFRQRRRRLPRFVLLLDVSQSMDIYAKLFLRFTRHLMSVFEHSEAYAFNIELIALGQGHRKLQESDFEEVLNNLSKGWLGGTKIAESLQQFNSDFAGRAVNNKTTVVVFSDGCDTAPVEQLIPEVAALQRRSERLVWVNPLLGRFADGEKDPGMDPLQPYIDVYRSAHNLQSLESLEKVLLGRSRV